MKTNWYEHRLTKPGYGQFPYIIFKVGYALFMQIPIHFLKPGQEIDLQKSSMAEAVITAANIAPATAPAAAPPLS